MKIFPHFFFNFQFWKHDFFFDRGIRRISDPRCVALQHRHRGHVRGRCRRSNGQHGVPLDSHGLHRSAVPTAFVSGAFSRGWFVRLLLHYGVGAGLAVDHGVAGRRYHVPGPEFDQNVGLVRGVICGRGHGDRPLLHRAVAAKHADSRATGQSAAGVGVDLSDGVQHTAGDYLQVNQSINQKVYNKSPRLIDWFNPPSEKLPHGDGYR